MFVFVDSKDVIGSLAVYDVVKLIWRELFCFDVKPIRPVATVAKPEYGVVLQKRSEEIVGSQASAIQGSSCSRFGSRDAAVLIQYNLYDTFADGRYP